MNLSVMNVTFIEITTVHLYNEMYVMICTKGGTAHGKRTL